jgi:2,3-dihydroxy-p-cumate/2,3-dihydroxybenzoate 3,4-dioxygenase
MIKILQSQHPKARVREQRAAPPPGHSVCLRAPRRQRPSAARGLSDILAAARRRSDGEIAFRSDDRFRTVSLGQTSADGASVGIEVWDDTALEEIGRRLRELGFTVKEATPTDCRRRYVQSAFLTEDASGNRIDLVVRPTRSGRRYFPPRDAGIVAFHGVGLRTTDHARDLTFWRALGAEVSDWVGDIAYLRIDGLHHRVALYPSTRNGLLYAAFEVEALDQIMQNSYFMQESQIRCPGPGHEPLQPDVPARRGPGWPDLFLCERHVGARGQAAAGAAISA